MILDIFTEVLPANLQESYEEDIIFCFTDIKAKAQKVE